MEMRYLNWLEQTIAARLSAGAVGKPVFVRANLQLAGDHGHLVPLAAASLESTSKWIGAAVHRLYAQGGARQGFVSLLAEFASGQSALIAAEMAMPGAAEVRLLIVGQRGTFRFDDLPEPVQLGAEAPAASKWTAAIEASLKSGQAVPAATE